jgi:SAM-dependent methyltransferase
MQTVDAARLGLQSGERLLDLGCGEGRHLIAAYYAADIHAVGVDLCLADVLTTKDRYRPFAQPDNDHKQLDLMVSNAVQLPFASQSFDRIICAEVLEHLADWRACLSEIARILKPGGMLGLSVPRYWPERLCWLLSEGYHTNPGGHLRIFRAGRLRRATEERGLIFRRRHWAHALHTPYWWLKCLLWNRPGTSWAERAYHDILMWDIMARPRLTRILEQILNPIIGKSIVMYFQKPAQENQPQ